MRRSSVDLWKHKLPCFICKVSVFLYRVYVQPIKMANNKINFSYSWVKKSNQRKNTP